MSTTKITERNFDSNVDMAKESTLSNVNDSVNIVKQDVTNVNTNVTSVKTDVADIKSTVNTVNTNVSNVKSSVGATGDTGGSTTAGSLFGKLNKIIIDMSTAISNTTTNNTASKTGVLSAKLAYVISLLENTTYGLNALKTAMSNSGSGKKLVASDTVALTLISSETVNSGLSISQKAYFRVNTSGTIRIKYSCKTASGGGRFYIRLDNTSGASIYSSASHTNTEYQTYSTDLNVIAGEHLCVCTAGNGSDSKVYLNSVVLCYTVTNGETIGCVV